ncbi:MAG: hypothetical protein ACRCTQ_02920 [Brevinemataceae bacterium]
MKKLLLSLLLILGACSTAPAHLTPQEQAIQESISESKSRLPQEVLQNSKTYGITVIGNECSENVSTSTLTTTMIEHYMINDKYLSKVAIMYLNGQGIPIISPDITKNQWNNDITFRSATYETLELLSTPTIYNTDGSEYTPAQGSKFYKTILKQQDGWNAPCIYPDFKGKWFTNVNCAIGLKGFVLINVTDQELKMILISEDSGRYTVNTGYYKDVYHRI